MPATFVIDRAQRIRYAFVSADYTQRAEPNEVVAVLQRIAAGR
jgi:peroxiredoxin